MMSCEQIVFPDIIRLTIMHLIELLHKTFEEKLPRIHKIRLKSLMTACETVIGSNKRLVITQEQFENALNTLCHCPIQARQESLHYG